MIRSGRCNACRQRKVKCDESRPACQRCITRKQCCQYGEVTRFVDESSKQQIRFRPLDNVPDPSSTGGFLPMRHWRPSSSATKMVLSVRSARDVGKGHGLFQTLMPVHFQPDLDVVNGTRAHPRPHRTKHKGRRCPPNDSQVPQALVSNTISLAADFVAYLNQDDRDQTKYRFWGCWMDEVPSRVGYSGVLDAAVESVINGNKSFHLRDDGHLAKLAHRSYAKTLSELRRALTDPDQIRRPETIAAVKLLTAFEILMGDTANAWVSHARGVTKMLVAAGSEASTDDFSRAMFYSTYLQTYQDAMLNNNPSAFDSAEWLAIQAPGLTYSVCPQFPMASQRCMQLFTRIPRLAAAVRNLRQDASSHSAAVTAIALADSLYQLHLRPWEKHVLSHHAELVATSSLQDSVLVPMSFSFQSFHVCEVLVKYWMARITLLGLIGTLFAHVDPVLLVATDLREPSALAEETQCAKYIAMCVDYAEKYAPLGSLAIIAPLQVSFGAWYRSCLRERTRFDSSWKHASAMKSWALRKSNDLLRTWRAAEPTELEMELYWDWLVGDPMTPHDRQSLDVLDYHWGSDTEASRSSSVTLSEGSEGDPAMSR